MPWQLSSEDGAGGDASPAPVHLRFFNSARSADPGAKARERARRAAHERVAQGKSGGGAPGLYLDLGGDGGAGGGKTSGGKPAVYEQISSSGWLMQTEAPLSARKPLRGIISMYNSENSEGDSNAASSRRPDLAHHLPRTVHAHPGGAGARASPRRPAPLHAGRSIPRGGGGAAPPLWKDRLPPLELAGLSSDAPAGGAGGAHARGGGGGSRVSGGEREVQLLGGATAATEGWRGASAFTPRASGQQRGEAPLSARRREEGGGEGGGTPRAPLTPREVASAAQRRNTTGVMLKRLQSKEWNTRKNAADALAEMIVDDSVLDGVIGMLEWKGERARQQAVWALSCIIPKGHQGAVRGILRRLEHPEERVRHAALAALNNIAPSGDAFTVKEACLWLLHPLWTARESAVDAISQVASCGDSVALHGLYAALSDADWRVRQVALEAIENLSDGSLPSMLLAASELRRRWASGAGGATATPRGTLPGKGAVAVPWGGRGGALVAGKVVGVLRAGARVPDSVGCAECKRTGRVLAGRATGDGGGAGGGTPRDTALCGACVEEVCKWVDARVLRHHWLALAMGSHPRLGEESLLLALDTALIPIIAGFCR